jgi:hypothetical protein
MLAYKSSLKHTSTLFSPALDVMTGLSTGGSWCRMQIPQQGLALFLSVLEITEGTEYD